jgi:arylsulfatase A-like enzyme
MRAVCLLLVFVLGKALVLAGRPVAWSAWTLPAYLWQDVLVALVFAGLDHAWRRRPRVCWALYATAVACTAINVPVGRVLSTPLTWPLLRATRGPLLDSITYHATPANLLCVAVLLAASIVLPLLLPRLLRGVSRRQWVAVIAIVVVCLPLGPVAAGKVRTAGLERNVVAVLVTTALPRVTALDLEGDWPTSPLGGPSGEDLTRYRGAAAGRNVVVVHLESTAAAHLRPWGAARDPMPHLTRLASEGILFENAYTAYPETIKSFFAVQCAAWPALDTTPEVYERVPVKSLASVLAERGYRTGLFHSGRFVYLGMQSVLRGRGWQTLMDGGDIGGEHSSSFGIDEPSAVRRLLRWLDEGPKDRPFLATYLPIAGHHPYETPAPGPFPVSGEVDRYHNALHYADDALGQLLDGLRRRGLDRTTLLVLLGDHGEAFGEHAGNFGHTLAVYEENVRVPLHFAAAGAISSRVRVGRVASLVDVAPTVLDLLAVPAPAGWQGQSLLDPQPRMALFGTDYSLGLLGLRDGQWKLLHEMESGRSSLYDLHDDPGETHDVAADFPGRAAVYREHLRRWAAAQKFRVTHP